MTERNLKIKSLKNNIDRVLRDIPEANKLEYRNRAIRMALIHSYPNTLSGLEKGLLVEIIHDTIYLDRILRLKTKGKQKVLKINLEKTIGKDLSR